MNDEFLHRLRQPPPPAFAARLRARLESQSVARGFRQRQITLYTLIACLLGSTALALAVPGVREAARALVREVLPEPPSPSSYPPSPPSAASPPRAPRQAPESGRADGAAQPPALGAAAVAATPTAAPAARGPFARAVPNPATIAVIPRAEPMVEMGALRQVKLIGGRQVAAALSDAISEFQDLHRDVRIVTVPTSNTKALARFCAGEGDIAMVTRMITPSELDVCKRFGIGVTALPIAYDALAVLTNTTNDWTSALRLEDLKILFDPRAPSGMFTWSQFDPRWPGIAVSALAARGLSFTDTFSELVFGTTPPGPSNSTASQAVESRLLQRLQRASQAVTYVTYSSYLESQQRDSVKLLEIVNESGAAVAPSRASITDGSYALARPLLLFMRRGERDGAAEDFVEQVLTGADRRLAHGPYLPLSRAETRLATIILRAVGLPPFEPPDLLPLTAREILLQQLPAAKRESERARLEVN